MGEQEESVVGKAIVEAIVSYSVERLGDQLFQEANSFLGVRDEVEWVESQFRWMRAFLQDAEAKSDKDERVMNWICEVRNLSYLAEDIIDSFLVEIAPAKHQGVLGTFWRIIARYKLASEIERLKGKILSISDTRKTYGIENLKREEGTSVDEGLLSPNTQKPDFVGLQSELETLTQQLMQGKQTRSAISIVGMGGQGKTTLAKKLCQSEEVRRHFHICLWVSVSKVYVVKELLLSVLKQCFAATSNGNIGADELREKIAEYLREKRYLVILDGVWTGAAWDDLKDAFPDTENGSRVLLTTSNKEVAFHADPTSEPHELRFLNEDESWELFIKKACSCSGPIDSRQFRNEILSKCRGLPLAIVIIGGLLSRRKEAREWQNIIKSIDWQLIEGQDGIAGLLSLSYKDLPYYLKPCFLYLGIFPEDYEIPAKKLIQLWVAEGFVRERGPLTLEEVGEEYLNELLRRSLIHDAEKSSSRAIKSCRIHRLLRDFALSKAEKEAFLETRNPVAASKPCKGRRLALHHSERFDFLRDSAPNLRSLLIHRQGFHRIINGRDEKLICGSFKLLRVLDIEGMEVEKLPSEIGELIHLKYLGFAVRSKSLPPNMGNLRNLQTLCISHSLCQIRMPIAILEIKQLRHVRVTGNHCWIEIEGHPGLDQLWSSSSLQTLENIVASKWMDDGCLGRLRKLRKLGLDIYLMPYRVSVEKIWKSIMTLECLESLYARTRYGSLGQVPSLNHLLNLCKLHLDGKIENPPALHELPRKLTKLTLTGSCLEQDPLPILEKLEFLRNLSLYKNSYTGEKMTCSARGFPQLQFLKVAELPCLREWRMEKGSMPCLLDLVIIGCSNLEVPDLQHASILQKFEIFNMSAEFKDKIKQDSGTDWYKIQHVSSVIIW